MDEEPDGNDSPEVQESVMGALIGARGVPGGLQGLSADTIGDSPAEPVRGPEDSVDDSDAVADGNDGISAETAELLGLSPETVESVAESQDTEDVQPEPEPELAEPEAAVELDVEAEAEVEVDVKPEVEVEEVPEPEEPAVEAELEVEQVPEEPREAEPEVKAEVEVEVEAEDEPEVEAPEPAPVPETTEPVLVDVVEEESNIDAPDPEGAGRIVLEWAAVLVGAVVMALVLRQFIFQAFWIPSESMETTLEISDRVLVNRLSYQWGEVGRGDIVVFARRPEEVGEIRDLIKRVIGLPGETVEGRDNSIYIDGVLLDEPYVDESNRTFSNFGPITVPEDEIFVMGDNRDQSFDSRLFGTVELDRVAGRAFVTFWPLDRVGSL